MDTETNNRFTLIPYKFTNFDFKSQYIYTKVTNSDSFHTKPVTLTSKDKFHKTKTTNPEMHHTNCIQTTNFDFKSQNPHTHKENQKFRFISNKKSLTLTSKHNIHTKQPTNLD